MDNKTYTLNIKFVNGETSEIILDKPHRLVPSNAQPHALVYMQQNILHNLPFSSIMDFWFNPVDYNEVEKLDKSTPTPNCDCASCKAKKGE